MKKLLLFTTLLFIISTVFSQEKKGKPFFTGSMSFTLERNEFDEGFGDDEPFFAPAAVLVRTGFGYQFNRRLAASVHAGFDHHWSVGINAIPTYGKLRYNITEHNDDTFFIETSYGKLWRPSSRYNDGNYFGGGIGFQFAGGARWNTLLKLDYHRKTVTGYKNGYLHSVSFGIGFSFF